MINPNGRRLENPLAEIDRTKFDLTILGSKLLDITLNSQGGKADRAC